MEDLLCSLYSNERKKIIRTTPFEGNPFIEICRGWGRKRREVNYIQSISYLLQWMVTVTYSDSFVFLHIGSIGENRDRSIRQLESIDNIWEKRKYYFSCPLSLVKAEFKIQSTQFRQKRQRTTIIICDIFFVNTINFIDHRKNSSLSSI